MSEEQSLRDKVDEVARGFNALLEAQRNVAVALTRLAKNCDVVAAQEIAKEADVHSHTTALRDFYVREVLTRWMATHATGDVPTAAAAKAAAQAAYAMADAVLEARAEVGQ